MSRWYTPGQDPESRISALEVDLADLKRRLRGLEAYLDDLFPKSK